MSKTHLKIAIQKKGRLNPPSSQYLASLGLKFPIDDKRLAVACQNMPITLIKVRDNDIPKYVSDSVVDFGIVGLDVLKESGAKVKILKPLNFCKCKMVIAVPAEKANQSFRQLTNKRIATSYPNILKDFLKKEKIRAQVVVVEGSVELAPYLEAADAVFDIVETGRTLKEFNLIPIKTVLESQAMLIQAPKTRPQTEFEQSNFLKLCKIN